MTPSPDFWSRTNQLLNTARDDDTIVVALFATSGELLMQTRSPTPYGLVAIARTVLSQASDELDTGTATGPNADLLASVDEALAALPDDTGA